MKKSEALRILGLSDGATDDEVKAAHRKKVVEFHPDKFVNDPIAYEKAEEHTKRINEARDVLLSRKWEPEFGGVRGGYPYGSPYSPPGGAGSYGGGTGQGGQGSPYEGWPFGQGQPAWVWTSWGDASSEGGSRSPFDPFVSTAQPAKTPQERKEEAKKGLINDVRVLGGKVLGLGVFSLFGLFPLGLLLYVVISLIYGLWKRLEGCLVALFVPLVIVFIPLLIFIAPRAVAFVVVLILAGIACLVFDVVGITKGIRTYRSITVD